ncbi:GTP-binding protein [Lactarius vividus]|nr:GTP-binding protein [Lactarius vividus]
MDTQQPPRRIPKIQFRVLIIGRANAGKTSILQRVCDTTESPFIYRGRDLGWGREKVTLDPSVDRGEHTIDDELMFSNHEGYIFHDSRGIESGAIEELEILQEFIRRKCGEERLMDRLHAIWYCVPMDNQRPQLDVKFFKDICPDRNVPVIVVFTKHDQFRRNVQIYVEDFGSPDDNVLEVAEILFQEHYLSPLGEDVRYVRLEKMHMQTMRCDGLIETTAAALNDDIVGLMLLAVQKGNLILSVKRALKR